MPTTSLRAIIVRGDGTAFAAGGDLDEFRHERATVDKALAYHEAVGTRAQCRRNLPPPHRRH